MGWQFSITFSITWVNTKGAPGPRDFWSAATIYAKFCFYSGTLGNFRLHFAVVNSVNFTNVRCFHAEEWYSHKCFRSWQDLIYIRNGSSSGWSFWAESDIRSNQQWSSTRHCYTVRDFWNSDFLENIFRCFGDKFSSQQLRYHSRRSTSDLHSWWGRTAM